MIEIGIAIQIFSYGLYGNLKLFDLCCSTYVDQQNIIRIDVGMRIC